MLGFPDRKRLRSNRSGWRRILANQAKEFCLSTGLHGYKYIAQSHRSRAERVTWAIGLAVSLCCAIALMQIAWEYNASHPTLTVIESTHHGIWNYPFPGVTVCDLNRISLSRTRDFVRSLKFPSQDQPLVDLVTEMRLLNELLDPGVFGRDVGANLTRLQNIFEFNNLTIPAVMKLVTRNCSEMLEKCKWKGGIKKCDTIFESSLSRDGICCSFNYLGVKATSDSTSSTSVKSLPKTRRRQPKRVTACGYQTGLTVLVNPAPEDYHASILGSYGVKLMLHDPFDYPDRNAKSKLIGIGTEVFVSVTPEVTYSTEEVRSLAVSKRNCIFSDEGQQLAASELKYSYHNCLAVCRSRTIVAKCQCLPYYQADLRPTSLVPRDNDTGSDHTRFCNLRDVACIYHYRRSQRDIGNLEIPHSTASLGDCFYDWYETSWPGMNVTSGNLPPRETIMESSGRPCGCIPDCNFLIYPLESSVGIFDRNNSYHDLKFYEGVVIKNRSVLHVFFSDLVSTQYRRDVYYNWHNLFASFGGLLGLFAGFSLMSGFELIYFFTIRLIVDLCVGGKKRRR